jgi:hypothetical protein
MVQRIEGNLGNFFELMTALALYSETKEEMVQFQAADLLAWKSHKVLGKVVEHDGSEDLEAYSSVQRSLAEINTIPHSYGVHIYESLERLIQRANVPLRERK